MKPTYPKISVIIITYNQEKLISRAIDSVINQKDYLHELIISDDCSKDKTWDVVKKYKEKFPGKIKVQRHKQNLGIYENLESTYHLVTGEIIFFLSGDDAMGEDLLKSTCELLVNKEVDYKKDRFCVLTDYKVVYPDGREEVRNNNLVKKYDPFKLKLRGLIVNRALGLSSSILESMRKINISSLRKGDLPSSLQEGLFDQLPYYFADKIYYISVIGNVYFKKTGISVLMNKQDSMKEINKNILDFCDKIPDYYDNLSTVDIKWLTFLRVKSEYFLEPILVRIFRYFINLIILLKDPFRKYLWLKEVKIFIKNVYRLI
ncbi:glycosyl transferase family 2 [Caldithrix abyssi DSM 13497]|uniref:Glycosyl transferase family 2 n=1 Tax=Caldithrix abyssi DSM 13497 TaxID=880073 RepID=H1XS52_CALAY|nr:glycosyltransferase [Caldithrix abyssi]APF20155.1 Glycosyl transferase family 2 [Caldithrix abyssi DSM 13497]EHO40216.1 glycosyl transferase family 2 [Caldithrix abyssi DSM 13497]